MTELRRDLGFWDLVLFHIVAIIGLRWLAVAAGIGYSSIFLWILAMLGFFFPQAYVLIRMSRKWPVEGGLYEWVKMAMGPFHGYLSGWCYWVNNITYYPSLLTAAAGFAVYVFVPPKTGLEASPAYIVIFSLVMFWLVLLLNMIGVKYGKWVENIGGISTWIPAGLVAILGTIYCVVRGPATPFSASSIFPVWNFDTLSTWALLCFAFAGFELVSLLGGEIKNPERNIPRSIVAAGIISTAIYILGSLALIVSLPRDNISMITGIVQALQEQTRVLRLGFLVPIMALLLVLSQCGGVGAWLAGSGRMLFVVGVDRYLPKAFSQVHPKWGTPHVSMITQAVIASLIVLLSAIDTTVQQFYRLLLNYSLIIYFIPYLYLFASHFQLMRRRELPMNFAGVLASVVGFLSTLVSIVLGFIPSEEAVLPYELKVFGVTIFMVGIGLVFYFRAERK